MYKNYYKAQAGNGLPGFQGIPVVYCVLEVYSIPCLEGLLKKILEIIKPYAKSTSEDIAKNMVGHVSKVVMDKLKIPSNQDWDLPIFN